MLLVLFSSLLYIVHSLCPEGFELVRNGQCHKLVAEAHDIKSSNGPKNAKDFCEQFDSLPVMIRNQEDHDYWMGVAKENHKKGENNGFVLLGLECNSKSRWEWMDGSSIDFEPPGYHDKLDGSCDNSHDSWAYSCLWAVDPVQNTWSQWCFMDHDVDVYCITAPEVIPEPDRDCTNFSHDDDDDVCYQVGVTASNWTEANTICHSFGANVASVHNDQENAFLRRLAVSKGLVNGLMLGASTNNAKNTYKWVDGSDWDYKNFASGFPLAGSGDCLSMQTDNVGGQWTNVECSSELPFACVRQTDAQVPTCDGALHKEGDIIYSPGFPSSSSEPCDFILKVDPGMIVEMEILFLEANECCDKLELFEGSLGGNIIAIVSGEEQGRIFRTESDNVMRASWQPNGGVDVRGMMITFRGVPK